MTQGGTLGRREGTSPTGAVSPPAPPPPLTASATALLPGCSSVCRKGLAVLPWNLFRTCALCPFGHGIGRERPWTHTGCLSPLLFLSISRSWSILCLDGSRVPHGLSRRQEQVEVAAAQERQRGSWRWGLCSARCLLPTPQVLLRGSLTRVASGSPLDQPPKELPDTVPPPAPPTTATAWSPAGSSLSVSPAIPAREAAGPDPAARGRQGVEGEPGPPGGHRVRHPGQLPQPGQPGRLRALREDEIGPPHRAARAGGQDPPGRRAAQVPAGQPSARQRQMRGLRPDASPAGHATGGR